MAGELMGRLASRIALVALAVAGCKYDNGYTTGPTPPPNAQIVSATGDLTAALAQFRGLLGDSANRTAGEQPGGRREINWDGVNGAVLNVDTFPGDFFNRVVPRGQIFTTPGTGLRVTNNALGDLDPTQFVAFSPTKVFLAVGSPTIDVSFVIAGGATPARVKGFGVVFVDVDLAGSGTLEFFGADGALLRKVNAPIRSDAAGHSFVGAVFDEPLVARVRITAGQAPVSAQARDISQGGGADLVVVDDFISAEPHPIQ
jgi:hypothetical protein